MLYIKNVVRFLTFVMVGLSMYSVGYVQAMELKDITRVGLSYSKQDEYGNTPLCVVIKSNNPSLGDIVEMGLNYNKQDENGDTPLHKVVRKDNPSIEVVKYLINKKSDLNLGNKTKKRPLHLAVCYNNNPSFEIIKCLVENKADLNVQDIFINTPLHYVLHRPDIVKYFIQNKADLSLQDKNNHTPLHLMVWCEHPSFEIIKCFIENERDLNVQDHCGNTPLHIALRENNSSIVKYLVENKANLNLKNNLSDTPLCQALSKHSLSIEIVKCLVENKADLHEKGQYDCIPLFAAINNNSIEAVKYLIDNKSDINIKCRNMTFWAFLVRYNSKSIQSLNKVCAIDFRRMDSEGKTILDYAYLCNNTICNDILNLERTWRTLEETKTVENVLGALHVLRKTKKEAYQVPKPILVIIFKLVGIPTHGNSVKFFEENLSGSGNYNGIY